MNLNLNYEGFEAYLLKEKPTFGGIQYVFKFENQYGASVIKHWGSYGHDDDLWEVAVLKFYPHDWDLCYDTPITDDVVGYLTDDEVKGILRQIQELESVER